MNALYGVNGLMFWSEEEIFIRNMVQGYLLSKLKSCLMLQNSAFQFFQCEGPIIIPKKYLNANYNEKDIFITQVDDLVLRPETTPSSYIYALDLLNTHNETRIKPPIVVWQHGKSARYEQDLTVKNMRLKEFYQLEFQIIFSDSTRNDYYPKVLESMRQAISELIGEARLEKSDRLPDYSLETVDIVYQKNDMELCSISRRVDFPLEKINVIEVAFGTDRCVYNFAKKATEE